MVRAGLNSDQVPETWSVFWKFPLNTLVEECIDNVFLNIDKINHSNSDTAMCMTQTGYVCPLFCDDRSENS